MAMVVSLLHGQPRWVVKDSIRFQWEVHTCDRSDRVAWDLFLFFGGIARPK